MLLTVEHKRGRKAILLERYIKEKLDEDVIAWYEPINGPCMEMQGYAGGWYCMPRHEKRGWGEPLGYNFQEAKDHIDLTARLRLPDRCKSYKNYKATKPPTCCGGKGCKVCWDKYEGLRPKGK